MEKWSFMELLNTPGASPDDYQEIYLSPFEVVTSESNFYSQKNIEELADSMLAVGQQQPTVVAQVNGVYKIISGHRRNLANIHNIECGALPKDYRARYLYKDMSPSMFELSLIIGNIFNRVPTPYEETEQAHRLKEALIRARESDGLEIRGKLRDAIADMMHTSAAEVGRMNKINNSLVPEAKEQFKAGKLGKSAAYETSRLSEEAQKDIAEAVAMGQEISRKIIAERAKEKQEAKAIKCEEKADAQGDRDKEIGFSGCGMREHELKTYPKYFHDVISKIKTFEVRENDRKFHTGDVLHLKEWDNIKYSGREVKAKIIYMLDDRFVGIMPGYVILGIELIENF